MEPSEKEAILKRVEQEVADAEKFALESPPPDSADTYKDVLSDPRWTPRPPWYENV